MKHTWLGGPYDGQELDRPDCSPVAVAVEIGIDLSKDIEDTSLTFRQEWWLCKVSYVDRKHYLVKEGSKVTAPGFDPNKDYRSGSSTESGLI